MVRLSCSMPGTSQQSNKWTIKAGWSACCPRQSSNPTNIYRPWGRGNLYTRNSGTSESKECCLW